MGGSFYVVGGTLSRDALCYVTRKADSDLLQALRQSQFCYVLTSRQMGKSSLMVRAAARLREEGVAVAVLDLTAIGQNLSADQWYSGLLSQIGQHLDLEDELEDFWMAHPNIGRLLRFTRALREVVLEKVAGNVVLFVDEVDAVRSLPFSTDEFFAGIREVYNRRPEDPTFRRLTFCLLGVATPNDLVRDARTTPFNIGTRIELRDFTMSDAEPLMRGFPLRQTSSRKMDIASTQKLLERVLYWTGGHPYLTQRLCRAIAEDPNAATAADVDRHCEDLFLSNRARETDDNLLFVRRGLLQSDADLASLLHLYQKVQEQKQIPDDEANPLVSVLKLSGVVGVESGQLKVRNRIYAHVFDRNWITENMPGSELRRQREAYRRGVLRTVALASLVVAGVGGLAYYGFANARQARLLAVESEARRREADRYAALAMQQMKKADEQKLLAEKRQAEAEQSAIKARKEEQRAKNAEANARNSARIARQEKDRADKQARLAEKRRQQAEVISRLARDNALAARKQEAKALQLASEKAEQTNRALAAVKESAEMSYKLGRVYLNQSQYDSASQSFTRAFSLYQQVDDKLGSALSMQGAGEVCLAQKQFEQGRDLCENALPIYRDLSPARPLEEARCLTTLGILYTELNEPDKAREKHERALSLREKQNVPREVAETLIYLGRLYARANQFEAATRSLERAYALLQKNGTPSEQAAALHALGEAAFQAGRFDMAHTHYKRELEMREQQNDAPGMIACLEQLGATCEKLQQTQQAADYRNRATLMRREMRGSTPMPATPVPEKAVEGPIGSREETDAQVRLASWEGDALPNRFHSGPALCRQASEPPGPPDAPGPPDVAVAMNYETLRSLGIAAFNKGDFKQALEYFLRALAAAEAQQDRLAIVKSLHNVGVAYGKLQQYEDALAFCQRALEAGRALDPNSPLTQSILTIMGMTYGSLKQWDKAIECYQQAITILKTRENDTIPVAMLRSYLADGYTQKAQWDKGREEYKNALTIYQKLAPGSTYVAMTLFQLGSLERNAGALEIANVYYRLALPIFEAQGAVLHIAETWQMLGETALAQGAYDQALNCFTHAGIHGEKVQESQVFAQIQFGLGRTYGLLGQSEKAQPYLQRALTFYERIEDKSGQAQVQREQGLQLERMGRYAEALQTYQQAGSTAQAGNCTLEQAALWNAIGRCQARLGQLDAAASALQTALEVATDQKDTLAFQSALITLGDLALAQNQLEKARERFAQALKRKDGAAELPFLTEALVGLGRVALAKGNLEEAEERFAEALQHREQMSFEMLQKERVISALFYQAAPHAYLADVLVRSKRVEEALLVVERSRLHSLMRSALPRPSDFAMFSGGQGAGMPGIRLQNLLNMAQAQAALQQIPLHALANIEPLTDKEKQEIESQLKELEKNLAEGMPGKRERRIFLRSIVPTFKPLTPADLKTLCKANPDTLYLQWVMVDENRTLLFVCSTQEKLRAVALPVGRDALAEMAENWRQAMLTRQPVEPALAQKLYRALFGNLEQTGTLPGRYTRLVLVADGPLYDLAFAALMDGKNQRLIERYALTESILFSSLTWPDPASRPDKPLLVVADPSGQNTRLMHMTMTNQPTFPDLPFAQEEGKAVFEVIGKGILLNGGAAQEGLVRSQIGRCNVLHFATPALVNGLYGQRSFVMLAPTGPRLNGLLDTGEIARMRLTANMVVLSGSDTTRGQGGGGGQVGLAWAFRSAGVPSLVLSQWIVEDVARKNLMVEFYKGIKAGKRKDDALREAMLMLKKEKSAPYFWASFHILGTPNALINAGAAAPGIPSIPRPPRPSGRLNLRNPQRPNP
jgi:tetratricopeptide (TPR) repeat protein